MHIPDAAVSPVTSITALGIMAPIWGIASRVVRRNLDQRSTPILAITASFCFTIMMFNIPVPGGTTVHPIGGGIMAVLLGPWAAIIGITTALVIQALFFGDGGVLAIGLNTITMAVAMPVTTYAMYRLVGGRNPSTNRRAISAGIGAYCGINAAAFMTAMILGVQAAIFKDSSGHAMYFPFPVAVTLPAILLPHLTIAGAAECVVTASVVRFMNSYGVQTYQSKSLPDQKHRFALVWAALVTVVLLSPIGLLSKGDAWGEWGSDKLKEMVGYYPVAMQKSEARLWKGFNLFPDYMSEKGSVAYILAGALGIGLISVVAVAFVRVLAKRRLTVEPHLKIPELASRVDPGTLPGWLMECSTESDKLAPSTQQDVSTRISYLEKSVQSLLSRLSKITVQDSESSKNGLLHNLDPRAKIIVGLGAIVVTTYSTHFGVIVAVHAAFVGLALMSKIDLRKFYFNVWLAVPVFSAAITVPMLFNFVNPGHDLIVLLGQPHISITGHGIFAFTLFTMRIATAIMVMAVITVSTPWQILLRGFAGIGFPSMFIYVASLTYRYLVIMLHAASELFLTRQSRVVTQSPIVKDQGIVGGAIAAIFGKTLTLSEDVNYSMISRGWTGQMKSISQLALRKQDAAFICISLPSLAYLLYLSRTVQ